MNDKTQIIEVGVILAATSIVMFIILPWIVSTVNDILLFIPSI